MSALLLLSLPVVMLACFWGGLKAGYDLGQNDARLVELDRDITRLKQELARIPEET